MLDFYGHNERKQKIKKFSRIAQSAYSSQNTQLSLVFLESFYIGVEGTFENKFCSVLAGWIEKQFLF